MTQLVGLLMTLILAAGALGSGKDVLDMTVRLAQVATERMTMNQIGKAILLNNTQRGRKLTLRELPEFLKNNITGGRDVTRDIWGTPYYLKNDDWRGLVFKPGGDEFVLCSAGPDKQWWNRDDELWANFVIPENLLFDKPSAIDFGARANTILTMLDSLLEQTLTGLKKLIRR